MGTKLDFHVFFLVFFAFTAGHWTQGEKIARDGKLVNPNEDQIQLASNYQAIVCYQYTGQVCLLILFACNLGKSDILYFFF